MHPILEQLITSGPVVTDGAWGTQLQERGLPVGACPDAWNLSHPERVEEVARAYVEAGSQVILTNTFGANRFILARHGLGDQVAASIARGWRFVPRGSRPGQGVRLAGAQRHHAHDGRGDAKTSCRRPSPSRPQAMAAAGADGIVVETMTDPAEARLAIAAAAATGLPVVACMTFDSGAKLDRTMMGTTPEQAAEQLLAAGADVRRLELRPRHRRLRGICRRLHAASGRPVWIKANAGMPEMRDGRTVYTQTAEQFADYVPQLIEAGAAFLGGCCGTTPEFIRAVCK